MIFSSQYSFLRFCPIFFLTFLLLAQNIKLNKQHIIIGSMSLRMGTGDFFLYRIGTLIIDYILGNLIYKYRKLKNFA
jgi:hypothetical protein